MPSAANSLTANRIDSPCSSEQAGRRRLSSDDKGFLQTGQMAPIFPAEFQHVGLRDVHGVDEANLQARSTHLLQSHMLHHRVVKGPAPGERMASRGAPLTSRSSPLSTRYGSGRNQLWVHAPVAAMCHNAVFICTGGRCEPCMDRWKSAQSSWLSFGLSRCACSHVRISNRADVRDQHRGP